MFSSCYNRIEFYLFSFFLVNNTVWKLKPLKRPARTSRRAGPCAHLNLLVYLRHTFLGVDIEDERSQGLNVAVVD